MKYSPPLDGLRAISVLTVLAFHLGYGHFSGGFLGVDVFFALSGYLITRNLLAGWERTGSIQYLDFYSRRTRRLLPALIGCLLFSWVIWPVDGPPFARAALPAILYYANWKHVFDLESLGPLAHTWSLSIEEQFYIAWPFSFALILTRTNSARRAAVWTGWIAFALALSRLLLFLGDSPLASYGSTFARMDEILIGAFIGLVGPSYLRQRWIVYLAGACLIAAVILATESSPWLFCGGFSLLALAAAILADSVVGHPSERLAHCLSWRPLLEIGKRSYGIYLFHLPIVRALEPLRTEHSLSNFIYVSFLRVGLTLAVAWFSYRYIETPFLARKERGRLSLTGEGKLPGE